MFLPYLDCIALKFNTTLSKTDISEQLNNRLVKEFSNNSILRLLVLFCSIYDFCDYSKLWVQPWMVKNYLLNNIIFTRVSKLRIDFQTVVDGNDIDKFLYLITKINEGDNGYFLIWEYLKKCIIKTNMNSYRFDFSDFERFWKEKIP